MQKYLAAQNDSSIIPYNKTAADTTTTDSSATTQPQSSPQTK